MCPSGCLPSGMPSRWPSCCALNFCLLVVMVTGPPIVKVLFTFAASKVHFTLPPSNDETNVTFLPFASLTPLLVKMSSHGRCSTVIVAAPSGVVVLHAPPASPPVELSAVIEPLSLACAVGAGGTRDHVFRAFEVPDAVSKIRFVLFGLDFLTAGDGALLRSSGSGRTFAPNATLLRSTGTGHRPGPPIGQTYASF